jgi:hypothetical protein
MAPYAPTTLLHRRAPYETRTRPRLPNRRPTTHVHTFGTPTVPQSRAGAVPFIFGSNVSTGRRRPIYFRLQPRAGAVPFTFGSNHGQAPSQLPLDHELDLLDDCMLLVARSSSSSSARSTLQVRQPRPRLARQLRALLARNQHARPRQKSRSAGLSCATAVGSSCVLKLCSYLRLVRHFRVHRPRPRLVRHLCVHRPRQLPGTCVCRLRHRPHCEEKPSVDAIEVLTLSTRSSRSVQ